MKMNFKKGMWYKDRDGTHFYCKGVVEHNGKRYAEMRYAFTRDYKKYEIGNDGIDEYIGFIEGGFLSFKVSAATASAEDYDQGYDEFEVCGYPEK